MSEGQRAEQLVTTGWALYQAGNRRGALRDFRAALAIDPDNPEALVGLSQAQIALGSFVDAGETADRLLELAPNMAQAHRIRGEVFRRQRKLTPAARYFKESIRLNPDEALGYHYLGVAQFERKQYAEALKTVDEGRRIAPWYGVLAAQKALILLHHKGPKAAEPFADEALRLSPDETYVMTEAARIALMRGKLQKAHDLLEVVLHRDANDEDAISLFLLTEPDRYRLLRANAQFQFWRKGYGLAGWLAWLLVWLVLFAALIVVALAGRVPAFVVAVAYQLFWRAQYAGHRKRVRAHFAQPQLKPGF
ncbi:MAG: tetratricopeptide repeat protein [Hyphomonadaceae bacterium]